MNTVTFAFLFILLTSIQASDLRNSLDDNLFKEFLDEAYKKTGAEEKVFINKIWPKIMSGLIPDTVLIPAEEDTCENCGWYVCATETKIYPKLKRINRPWYGKLTRGLIGEGWKSRRIAGKNMIRVDVELEFTKPLNFELAEKLDDGSTFGMVPVSYKFKGKNKVQVALTIPDFSKIERKYITQDCLVYINSVYVTQLGRPDLDKKITKGKVEREFATVYKKTIILDYHNLFTVGIVKAVRERLGLGSWICAHKSLNDQNEKYEQEKNWDYSSSYKQHCNDKRAP